MSDRPKMCASCGKLMGVADVCPYCGADNRAVSVRAKRVLGRVGGEVGMTSVTGGIIAVNLLLYAVALAIGGIEQTSGLTRFLSPTSEVLFQLGLQSNPAIDAGQWWRVVTPIFLHLGLLHLLFNCYILWAVGRMVEQDLGPRLMFLAYVASGVLGFVASYYQGIGGGGASGAVAGMLGLMLVRRRLVDGDFRHPATAWVIQLVVLNALFGLMATGINNTAHLIGFLTGGAFGFVLTKVRLSRLGAVVLMLLTWGAAAVTLASFGFMLYAASHGGPGDLETATSCWQKVEAVAIRPVFDPERGAAARACLADVPRLEPTANEAAEQASRALATALEAWDAGESQQLRRASDELAAAVDRYGAWVKEAAPRYGARYVGP